MNSKKWASVVGAGVLALGLAACGTDDPDDDVNGGSNGNGGALSGEVVLDGSSTVAPISEVAAELFMGENQGVQVSVATSGTGGGFQRFCNGETDISNASRPISDEEAALCADAGVDYEQITVGNDALTVLVNVDNPVDCLTMDQLRQMWEPDSTLTNWNQVDGIDFDASLDLYGPGTDSGTFDFFTDEVMGEEGAQRTDYNNIGEDDNTGLIGVEGAEGGMFYVGYTYYIENTDRVKALQIDEGTGCVEPSPATAQDESYALSRGLFVFPSAQALARPEVQAFVDFYINENDAIAEAADAISLTDAQKTEMLDAVAQLAR